MSAALKQAAVVVVLALGASAFTPVSAQTMTEARAAAIHECSTKAAKKHKDYVDETAHIATYRTCMTEKGQRY
jgi:hypothetical protein